MSRNAEFSFVLADVPGQRVQERLLSVASNLKLQASRPFSSHNSEAALMRLLMRQPRPFGFNSGMGSASRAVENKPGK